MRVSRRGLLAGVLGLPLVSALGRRRAEESTHKLQRKMMALTYSGANYTYTSATDTTVEWQIILSDLHTGYRSVS